MRFHTPRRTTAMVSLGLTALMSACSAGHTAVVEKAATDAIVLAATLSATSLDFTTTGSAAIPAALMSNVYETLVTIDPHSGAIQPGLAKSWDISPDNLTYTFHLREGVTFSNGDAFTASTAAFSINYVRNHWTNTLAAQMSPVAAARAVDDHTLEVTLNAPSQRWLWSMSTAVGAMMSPRGVDDLAAHPVGTGPFSVGDFSPGEFITLKVNPRYWATPAAQDITIQYFPDTITAVNALQSGSVDIVWDVQNPELLDNLPASFTVQQGTTNGEVLVSMNNKTAPFNDERVRKAVAYGIDRNAANQVLFGGLATDTGGAPIAPTDPYFTGHSYYEYDPSTARRLMEEAGAVGTELTITVPTRPYTQTLAELLYSQLTAIGFKVNLASAEFPAVWLGQVMGAKDYQMSIVAQVEPRDITTMFGNPDYYLGYDDARTRLLFTQADQAPTTQEFNACMEAAVDQIMADAGALTLFNMPNIVLTAPGITGVDPNQVSDGMNMKNVRQS